jgi:hypothetical protein
MDRASEYLRLLQEKNRLKKMMTTKTKEEQLNEELEKGFTTHFRGAHAAKESKPAAQVVTSVKPVNILSRLTQGSRFGWGGERKHEAVQSPREHSAVDAEVPAETNRSPAHRADDENEDYVSDFESFSDAEGDRTAARRTTGVRTTGVRTATAMETVHEGWEAEEDSGIQRSPVGDSRARPSAANLDATSSLDASLQVRVKDLTAAQKLKLLQLLEQDVSTGTTTTEKMGTDNAEPDALIHSPQRRTKNASPQRRAQPAVSPSRPLPITPHPPARPLQQAEHTTWVADISGSKACTLRIRVTSSWDSRARFVSLASVRLRQPSGAGAYTELLKDWSCKVLCGMQALPGTNDAVRTLELVLGPRGEFGGRPLSGVKRGAAATWKAPLSSDAPLELALEGPLPNTAVELAIWNCTAPPLNCASARDVDIFVDSRCVWSGQLPDATDEGAGEDSVPYLQEKPATLVLRPFAEEIRSDMKRKPVTNEGPPHTSFHGKGLSADMVKEAPAANSTGSVSPVPVADSSSSALPAWLGGLRQQESAQDSPQRRLSLPRKLPVAAAPAETVSVAPRRPQSENLTHIANTLAASAAADTTGPGGSPKKATKPGRRARGDPASGDPNDTVVQHAGHDTKAAPEQGNASPTRAARRRLSRRDRDNGGAVPDPASAGPNDAFGGFGTEAGGPQLRQKREAELKKSLDSLALHEHFNLGRLSASKLLQEGRPAYSNAVEEGEEQEEAGEQSLEFAMSAVGNFADDSLNAPSTPLRHAAEPAQPQQRFGSASPVKPAPGPRESPGASARRSQLVEDSPSSQKKRSAASPERASAPPQQSRSEKIDQVQEKINSTLAGLAQIMQNFPAAGSAAGGAGGMPRARSRTELARPPREAVKDAALTEPSPAAAAVEPEPVRELTLQVFSNWGDAHYIGLNGIELYGPSGHLFMQAAPQRPGGALGSIQSITACPADLNVLPDTEDDPRRAANLLDGVNFTKNDLHSWLAPQLPFLRAHHPAVSAQLAADVPEGCLAVVTVTFDRPVQLAMCRVFNYNRSRARNQRGARWCKILLDGALSWEGYGSIPWCTCSCGDGNVNLSSDRYIGKLGRPLPCWRPRPQSRRSCSSRRNWMRLSAQSW